MGIKIVNADVEIHVTPLEEVIVKNTSILITFDDIYENRRKISFSPYQGVKITTIDCIDVHPFLINGKRPFNILEVLESHWIKNLKDELGKKDCTADFLDKAHHYVITFQDIIVEIVSWDNYKLE
jgi:hypothetical protein